MIRYRLKCAEGHSFDSWFASSEAFERLHSAGKVTCIECGINAVEKAMMAPSRAQSEPIQTDSATILARLRQHIETHSEDVGTQFASEARAIHDGEAPERMIHGQAKPDEARALIEDGVPVLPLPIRARREIN